MRQLLFFCACAGTASHFLSAMLGMIGSIAQVVAVLWIPLALLAVLAGFPLYAVVLKSALFNGLFDLPLSPRGFPVRHFFCTLAAFAVAASAWCILHLQLVAGPARMGHTWHYWGFVRWWIDMDNALTPGKLIAALALPLLFTAWFALFAVWVSWRQGYSLVRISLGVFAAVIVDALCGWGVVFIAAFLHRSRQALPYDLAWLRGLIESLGPGYKGHWTDHAFAMLAAVLTLIFYAALGVWGAFQLGKPRTVPSLMAPLMSVLVLGWCGAAAQFFLAGWHISLLLVVALLALLNGFIPFSDHTYPMVDRKKFPAPSPFEVLAAKGRKCAIVVASAGGGIQAAAWTAKVLEELHRQHGTKFDEALALISSISGGSMGSACYVNWIAQGCDPALPAPFAAASASSLDEVAWGLAWPDLLRLFFPLPCGALIDRALAMERAWIGNSSASEPKSQRQLANALSGWNEPTAHGELPALIMNSTIVETGGPLLLGTSRVAGQRPGVSHTWMDGDGLHVEGVKGRIRCDIPAVRAARLSATFPFVTPAARPARALQQPHMMDGGFYDNYGMATLTEWLDQALEKQALPKLALEDQAHAKPAPQVDRVLVLEINGFPPSAADVLSPAKTRGGWVKQLIAPLLALVNVRTAGQVSHREIERQLLCEKWAVRGITIETVNFELDGKDAPLSWHLMPSQIQSIAEGWHEENVRKARQKVADFLAGGAGDAQYESIRPAVQSDQT